MATTIVRAGGPTPAKEDFGLLAKFPGRWVGRGFNLIARPARQGVAANPVFFLELNATVETLEFRSIGGDVPNRGFSEPTASLHALRYEQNVTDLVSSTAIHFEPGLWLHVPKTAEGDESYVREATIPHGDSVLAQSAFFTTVNGGPKIDPINTFPFPQTDPIPPLNGNPANPLSGTYTDPYSNPVEGPNGNAFPAQFLPNLDPANVIKDPTAILRARIGQQVISSTDVIQISTTLPASGILNIPFVHQNANAAQMDAIFWIETVTADPRINKNVEEPETEFFQLQYVQRVILDFDGVHWPHVSVATLVKQ